MDDSVRARLERCAALRDRGLDIDAITRTQTGAIVDLRCREPRVRDLGGLMARLQRVPGVECVDQHIETTPSATENLLRVTVRHVQPAARTALYVALGVGLNVLVSLGIAYRGAIEAYVRNATAA